MMCPRKNDDCHICVQCGACRPGLTKWQQSVLEFNHQGKGYVQIGISAAEVLA